MAVDSAPILDLIEAFRRSKTMFTAVRLGIFDALEKKSQTAQSLASELNLNHAALTRLLNACVSVRLLEREGETYRNTDSASRYLVSTSPETLAGYVVYSDQSLFLLWAHLDDAIREGTNRWTQAFGSRDALFDHYFRDPAATTAFVKGMNGFGQISSPRVVRGFDLRGFTHLVDLGGATGHLAIAACEAYPGLRATVLDLARVEPLAQAHISQSSVASRVQFAVGDFFSGTLPSGDLYALSRILHDWSDSQITQLIEKIFTSLPSGGGLLIAEALVNDDRCGPMHALMQDLNMLVCTDGRERTFAEYRTLLEAAGFTRVDSHRTGSAVDAMLAMKG
jgi:acetylserotonin O-methyltransferase